MTNDNGTTLTWYASNLPKAITKDANNSSIFEYGPGRGRWKHTYKTGGTTYTHTYIGKLMEKVVSGATTSYKHYLTLGDGLHAVRIRTSAGADDSYYLHDDHLGSTSVITNAAGSNVVAASYDAYGDRRGTNWTGDPTSGELSTINGVTRRGFTDHEMLDSTAMVHMNGRVYEPTVGRFVSADPVKDCGLGTQGWNRYSYVGNRSLSLRDRSGFYVEDGQDQWWDSPITPRDLQESLDLQQNLYEMGLDYEWNRGNVPLTDPAPATPECEQASWRCAQSGDYWCEEAQRLGCYPNTDAYPATASPSPGPGSADPESGTGGAGPTASPEKCEKQMQEDEETCRSLPYDTPEDLAVRARCWQSANERYGACRANRPLPPLVTWRLPEDIIPWLPIPAPGPLPVIPPWFEPLPVPIPIL